MFPSAEQNKGKARNVPSKTLEKIIFWGSSYRGISNFSGLLYPVYFDTAYWEDKIVAPAPPQKKNRIPM